MPWARGDFGRGLFAPSSNHSPNTTATDLNFTDWEPP